MNKKYNRVGSIFQGLMQYKEIDSDSYFTRIITYIHQNPVVAGLCTSPENYKFSSYKAILSDKPTLIKRDEVIEWFGGRHGFIDDHKNNTLYVPEFYSSYQDLSSF